MRHEIHLDRDGETHAMAYAKDLPAARHQADKLIHKAHDGLYGIGRFELRIFELGVEGHLEKCVLALDAFYVPARVRETV